MIFCVYLSRRERLGGYDREVVDKWGGLGGEVIMPVYEGGDEGV